MRKEVIGNATLYLGDCAEILPMIDKVDAVITDPPYGIGADEHAGKPENGWTQWETSGWDAEKPSVELIKTISLLGKVAIIWGGNYFTDSLPPSMQWLVWDKGQRGFSLADCEFAWSSQNNASRIFNYARSLALKDGKQHPTQKPIALMKWCIDQCKNNPKTIFDPFMGSGTTGVAAVQMGKQFIGIEREQSYFDIACERIEKAQKQTDMFIEAIIPPQQATMEL